MDKMKDQHTVCFDTGHTECFGRGKANDNGRVSKSGRPIEKHSRFYLKCKHMQNIDCIGKVSLPVNETEDDQLLPTLPVAYTNESREIQKTTYSFYSGANFVLFRYKCCIDCGTF